MFGFAGLDLMDDTLGIAPRLPPHWRSLSFHVRWKGRTVAFRITGNTVWAALEEGDAMDIRIAGNARELVPGATLEVPFSGRGRHGRDRPWIARRKVVGPSGSSTSKAPG